MTTSQRPRLEGIRPFQPSPSPTDLKIRPLLSRGMQDASGRSFQRGGSKPRCARGASVIAARTGAASANKASEKHRINRQMVKSWICWISKSLI